MSIASTTNRVDYTGNDSAANFGYTFRIFSKEDLKVTKREISSGVETPLELETDYTVTGVGEEAGGEITLMAGALPATETLTIRRVVPLTQETDIRNQGEIFPEVLEDTYDHQVMIAQQQQDELDRSLKLPETISGSEFNGSLPASIAGAASSTLITNPTGDGFEVGPSVATINQAIAAETAAQGSADEAAQSVVTAERWANETGATVIDATTGNDSGEYSAKEYAVGAETQGQANGGSAKDWATFLGSPVDDVEYSAKEYALGQARRGQAGGSSAKDWATLTGVTVDNTELSAKEYALGSLKRGQAGGSSAKDWATLTGATVDNTELSAKEYALGSLKRGLAGGGSAKDWAQHTGSPVNNVEFSAKKYALDAQTAAASAAAQLASAFFRDVTFYSAAESPVFLNATDNGKLFVFDTSAGTVTVTLPEIASTVLPFNVAFLVDTAGADVVINRTGTDTIGGATTKILSIANTGCQLAADTDPHPDKWSILEFGTVGDGTVTVNKLAPNSVTTTKILDSNVTTAKIADANVTAVKLASSSVTDIKTSFTQMTLQKFTTGTGTYTTPAGVKRLHVRMVGGGGGGGGSGTTGASAGGVGGVSTFGTTLLSANGGLGGAPIAGFGGTGGAGGAASLGTGPIGIALQGGAGGSVGNYAALGGAGGGGGASAFGGGGLGAMGAIGSATAGGAGAANTGGGGGGGGGGNAAGIVPGGGGGSGGFVDVMITSSLAASYAYAVGAGGTAGTAGGSGATGGLGGSGLIIVEEYYQ